MVKIKKVNNGYLLMVESEYTDTGEKFWKEYAIQAEDDKKALKKLFFLLMDAFECYNSKHDQTHLIIKLKKNAANDN